MLDGRKVFFKVHYIEHKMGGWYPRTKSFGVGTYGKNWNTETDAYHAARRWAEKHCDGVYSIIRECVTPMSYNIFTVKEVSAE